MLINADVTREIPPLLGLASEMGDFLSYIVKNLIY